MASVNHPRPGTYDEEESNSMDDEEESNSIEDIDEDEESNSIDDDDEEDDEEEEEENNIIDDDDSADNDKEESNSINDEEDSDGAAFYSIKQKEKFKLYTTRVNSEKAQSNYFQNGPIKILDKQFSLISLSQAEFDKDKEEKQQLAEENRKLTDDLRKGKQEAESYKRQTENDLKVLKELRVKFRASEQESKMAKADKERISKEKEKMAEDLEYNRQQVEYYKRIADRNAELKGVAEFPEINDFLNCPICFEPCSETPEHRICSLACGHFFGKACITNWINITGTGSSKCPQCSRSATLKDVRHH